MKLRATAHLLLLCILFCLRANAQMTSDVFERVLDIRVNAGTPQEETATAFTVDVDDREYLLTAKHVVLGLRDEDTIDVFMNDAWVPLAIKIFRCDDPTDIAVLVPPRQLTVALEFSFEKMDLRYGQDVYFLGFPYGIRPPGKGINGPYPLALIKHGIMSGMFFLDPAKKSSLMLLDGYNNPGFSGAPIVYRDLKQGGIVWKLAGVVSGFLPEVVPVMKQHDIKSPLDASDAAKQQPWKIQRRANGTYFEYVENGTYVPLNTGIVRGFVVQPAIDLIRLHPIGPEVKELPGHQPNL